MADNPLILDRATATADASTYEKESAVPQGSHELYEVSLNGSAARFESVSDVVDQVFKRTPTHTDFYVDDERQWAAAPVSPCRVCPVSCRAIRYNPTQNVGSIEGSQRSVIKIC
jgi:hypothetical protein